MQAMWRAGRRGGAAWQRRHAEGGPGARLSTVKKVEHLATKQPVKLSVDQAFKRQRNRMLTTGTPEDQLRWERINAAWKLVPPAKRAKMIQADSDAAMTAEVMAVLDETGALRKAIRDDMLLQEDEEKLRVDESAAKVVLVGIVLIIVLTYLSIEQANKSKAQLRERRAAAGRSKEAQG